MLVGKNKDIQHQEEENSLKQINRIFFPEEKQLLTVDMSHYYLENSGKSSVLKDIEEHNAIL